MIYAWQIIIQTRSHGQKICKNVCELNLFGSKMYTIHQIIKILNKRNVKKPK